MSNFKKLLETVLAEKIDYDDPTERYWDRKYRPEDDSPTEIKKNVLYSKPIEPLKKEELVCIKSVNTQRFGFYNTAEMYLTNNKEKPYTYDKERAYKFPLSKAEEFIEKHPKQIVNSYGLEYERHFEIEKA